MSKLIRAPKMCQEGGKSCTPQSDLKGFFFLLKPRKNFIPIFFAFEKASTEYIEEKPLAIYISVPTFRCIFLKISNHPAGPQWGENSLNTGATVG